MESTLDHGELRRIYADSLEEWATKIESIAKWSGNTTNWHIPAARIILDSQTHGLLDHEIVVCERISAKLATINSPQQDARAMLVFRDLKLLLTNPGYVPPTINAMRNPSYADDVAAMRRIASMIRAGGGDGSNDGRDAWMYQQKLQGTGHTKIRIDLGKQAKDKGWDVIESDQGIGLAIDRYCERRGLELLRRKKKAASE